MGSKLFKIYSECGHFLQTYWRSEGLAEKTLSVMGAGLASYYTIKHGIRLFNYLRPIPFSLSYQYGSGSWVVITGATSPLGRAFALEFAKKGFSLCLISRSDDKLEALKKEIHNINNLVGIKIIAVDFDKCLLPNFFASIFDELKGLDISVLINNAGVDFFDYFTESTIHQLHELFCVNVFAVIQLTQFIVKKMLQRKFNSAVINLSSHEGVFPSAFSSVYSASKAFVDQFSTELAKEIGPKIDVLAFRPYWIRSDLPHFMKRILNVSAERSVQACLDQLSKGYTTYGNWKHALLGVGKEFLPVWVRNMGSKAMKPISIEERRKVFMRFEKRRRYI